MRVPIQPRYFGSTLLVVLLWFANVYLFKLGEKKFFYDPGINQIVMPMGEEEPRHFNTAEFFENIPKLDEFLNYLDTYSLRNRRKFILH